MSKSVTDERYREAQLASYWNFKFKEAMITKAPYTKRWQTYWDAYRGDYFVDQSKPDYKSDLVSNYIFSIVETIRPIMLDNDPKFQAMPRQPEGLTYAHDLQEAFLFEWDRERMSSKLSRELITTLVVGTTPYFIPWDSEAKQIRAIPFSPYNLFPDPLATSVEDAEYLIYAVYKNVNRVKQMFPKHAKHLSGGDINYGELVYDNNEDTRLDNQVLILEVWTRDYETFEEDPKGTFRQKYPNGRVLTIAPELGLVLADRRNPYVDGRFPFVLHKDYDIPGKFWGEGEVAQLLSPQKEMNELNNAILDNAKNTANMPWIVDKNSGIGYGKITSRPGLILRKNPGTEVRREQPPQMPSYVINAVETYKLDMEQISGVFDTLKGNSETGVYTAQGILALQEAGQARIRLKVKVMESFLRELGELWYSRMKQFWTVDRWVRIVRPDGTYDFKEIKKDALKYDYDINILAGSTMPVNRGAMLDLMIRLAQTPMPDGQPLVDRQAVAEYLPAEVKSTLLRRMGNKQLEVEQAIGELKQVAEQITKDLEAIIQESRSADSQTFDVIEDLTNAFEQIQKRILQLEKHYDTMEEERKAEEERNRLRNEGYNEGYSDAERILSAELTPNPAPAPDILTQPNATKGDDESILEGSDEFDDLGDGDAVPPLPEDILNGIEQLSDDELALLLTENPQLAELLR